MKVLILHRRLSGYFVACLRHLLQTQIVEVSCIAWPNQKNAPFDASILSAIGDVLDREQFNDETLLSHACKFAPDVVLVSGWADKGYVQVCKALKKEGVLIISGCDTQWKGSFRQYVAGLIAPCYVQKFIDVLWVSGERQSQLAAKLGYHGSRCWDGYYACDWNHFSSIAEKRFQRAEKRDLKSEESAEALVSDSLPSSLSPQPSSLTKTFAYVGRYAPEKGLDILAEAYRVYCQEVEEPWRLICAGQGDCQQQLIDAGAEDRGFIQPSALPDFLGEADCFILPSRFEPWGVVVQEAAALGLPLIVSDASGAGVHLLRDRWNGRSVQTGSVEHLVKCMLWTHQQSDSELQAMGQRSFELSQQYTPERWTQTLLEGVKVLKAED